MGRAVERPENGTDAARLEGIGTVALTVGAEGASTAVDKTRGIQNTDTAVAFGATRLGIQGLVCRTAQGAILLGLEGIAREAAHLSRTGPLGWAIGDRCRAVGHGSCGRRRQRGGQFGQA